MVRDRANKRLLYGSLRCLSRALGVLLFDIRVFGAGRIPSSGGGIIAANHQSYLDPWLLGVAAPRPLCFLARRDLFRIPLLGALIRALGARPIDRSAASRSALVEVVGIVRAGELLAIFPEGSRTFDGRIGPFLRGAAFVAARAEAPVIPAAIRGAFEAWPRTRRLPRTGSLRVAFGEPLRYDGGPGGADAFLCAVRDRVRLLWARLGGTAAGGGLAPEPGNDDGSRAADAGRPPHGARAAKV